MDSTRFVQLVCQLVSPSSTSRDDGAEQALDLRSMLGADETSALALLLAHLSATETDAKARESQLHALADFVESSDLPTSVADVVATIDPATLAGSEIEYVAFIRTPRD